MAIKLSIFKDLKSYKSVLASRFFKTKISWRPHNLAGLIVVGVGLLSVIGIIISSQQARHKPDIGKKDSSKSVHSKNTSDKDTAKPSVSPPAPQPGSNGLTTPLQPPPQLTPARLLNLTNWKLTLPIDTDRSARPDEVKQPELASFSLNPYFFLNSTQTGVVFRAYADGITTSGSKYPRSELREMVNSGTQSASWSSASGSHVMTINEAITHLPSAKPEVVAAQIHDASDDVIEIRLEGQHLFVEADGKGIGDLDNNYVLGAVFNLRIATANGHIMVSYNKVQKLDYAKNGSGYYFKAGCYTQSNTSKGDSPSAYGEVIIYGLQISHS